MSILQLLRTYIPTSARSFLRNRLYPPTLPQAALTSSRLTVNPLALPSHRMSDTVTADGRDNAPWTAPVMEMPWTRLVWIDCEMSGLDLTKDQIIELACIITDKNLKPVDDGISYVIKVSKDVLDGMDEWCTNQHTKTGLVASCLASPHTLEEVDSLLLDYMQRFIPRSGSAVLAGNSVHVDKAFLNKDMPRSAKHLHYRIVDVSSIKELATRWRPELVDQAAKSKSEASHRALDDIKASIEELAYYRSTFFQLSNDTAKSSS